MPAVPDDYLPPSDPSTTTAAELSSATPVTAVTAWATTTESAAAAESVAAAAAASSEDCAATEVAWRAETQVQTRQVYSSIHVLYVKMINIVGLHHGGARVEPGGPGVVHAHVSPVQ